MRLDINLATRPYEDAREFWMRWGLGVGVLAVLTVALLARTAIDWTHAGRDRHTIAELEQKISDREQERAQAQGILEQAANRSTREQSQFLNALIQRKAFSWTRVFEDLERVMPDNLHVVSLRPELNDQNQIELGMKVACETRSAAIELVHRMEASQHFVSPQLVSEQPSSEAGSGVSAVVVAIYIPEVPRSGK